MKLPAVRRLAFRFGWAQLAGHNLKFAIEDLERCTDQSYVAYTEFFATFLCPVAYQSVDDIQPIMFRNSERLQSHLGRLQTKA